MGIYLDDRFTEHPKFVAAGDEAGWLWTCALAYVNRNNTHGEILKSQIPKLTGFKRPQKLAERLVAVTLWHDQGDRYLFHDYEERNRAQIARREKSSKAATERWRKHRERIASGNAPSIAEHCPADAVPQTTNHKPVTTHPLSPQPRGEPANGERETLIAAAIDHLARRDLAATSSGVRDPEAWLVTARQRRRTQHADRIAEALEDDDLLDLTAEQLASWFDPDIPGLPTRHGHEQPPAPATYKPPDCDTCNGRGVTLDDNGVAHRCAHTT